MTALRFRLNPNLKFNHNRRRPVGAVNKEVQSPVAGDYVAPAAEVAPIVKDKEVAAAGVKEAEEQKAGGDK